MLKLIDIDSNFFKDEPVISIIHDAGTTKSAKGFVKSAADSRISEFAATIKPEPGKIYVHILAMGAGEFYGANRNADYFPEENLLKYYKTFETTPAHIFKHHINKNPEIAIGQVIFSVYNERMHRVEVVAWIDRAKGADVVEKVEKGEFPFTSMACHTPYDVCSICGNQARSRGEYCEHLTGELGKVYPDGRKVMALNVAPLKFFDMSYVFRPADVTSTFLQKLAASVAMEDQPTTLGSAEAAQMYGLREKSAELKKVSELIKEIEGQVLAPVEPLEPILAKVEDPDDSILSVLSSYELDQVFHAFAALGISPSVGYLAKLIGEKICGEEVPGIEGLVNTLIHGHPEEVSIPYMPTPDTPSHTPRTLLDILAPFQKSASLFPDLVMQRAVETGSGAVFGPAGSSQSYGQGPERTVDPVAQYKAMQAELSAHSTPGMLKTLATISGLAIAAKWLISQLIEAKIKENINQRDNHTGSTVKIVLVKSAQDATAVSQLVKASMLRDLTPNTHIKDNNNG